MAQVTVYPTTFRESLTAHHIGLGHTFPDILARSRSEVALGRDESAAVRGVLGMMKFGKHDSPVLLEPLGTLLTDKYADRTDDAKLLAARALLRASYEVPDGPARVAYRGMAANALQMQTPRRDTRGQIALQ